MSYKCKFTYYTVLIFLFASCSSKEPADENYQNIKNNQEVKSDSLNKPAIELISKQSHNTIYSFFYLRDQNDVDSFANTFTEKQRRIISDINRIDEHRINPVDSIVIPDPLVDSLIFYSPFPSTLITAEDICKLLLISRKIQAFAAYEYGVLVKWGPSSLGKESTPTPEGLFFTNWKAKSTISTVNEEWLMKWYFNIHNFRGISIHEYAMPGYPASHACVRLKAEDAQWFYDWANQWILTPDQQSIMAYGTPVIIYDTYNFEDIPIWKYLVINADTTLQSNDKIKQVLTPHLDLIIQRQSERDSLETNVL
ncbi:MAG: L,D-transpeptidase [Bacteroidia bacterium]